MIIPGAVWDEVVVQGRSQRVVERIQEGARMGWLRVEQPVNTVLTQALRQTLHAGEAEAICLALETKPDLLLMDESEGREIARRLGLKTRGIVGLLIQGKAASRLASIKPLLQELEKSGFYLSPAFLREILQRNDEGS